MRADQDLIYQNSIRKHEDDMEFVTFSNVMTLQFSA